MKARFRGIFLGAAVTFMAVALASPAYCQQSDEGPSPNRPHSQQRPNTTPTPHPGSSEQPLAEPRTQDALAFTGVVNRDKNNEITLDDPVTKMVYRFDDAAKAQPYLGKKVKVVGKLGMSSNIIEVASIEVLPDAGK